MKSTCKMTKALLGGGAVLLLVLTFVGEAAAQDWTQLTPTGGPPLVRAQHTAVHNPAANRMIVFAGLNGAGLVGVEPHLNDVWVLENADGLGGSPNWIQLSPTGGPPVARVAHSAIYDQTTNRMTVFAGNPSFGFCFGTVNDTWVLSNADGTEPSTPAWTQLSPTGGPPSRRYIHSAIYDPVANRMIVFGGADACGPPNDEVWVLTNANGLGGTPNWIQLSPTGGPPAARIVHSAIYDQATNRMIVFGGCTSIGCVTDVWVLENANGLGGTPNWIQLSPTGGPPILGNHRAVYDPTANRMIVFGGTSLVTGFVTNEVWVLENANGLGGTPNWIQLSPTGGPPPERFAHSAVLDVGTNRMTVFAGSSNITGFASNDVWVLTNANGIVPPEEAIQNLIDVLQGIVDSNPGTPLADKIEDAIAKAQTALDELNKTPPDSQAAVGNIEGAVGDLEAAIGLDPAQDPTITDLMDQLAGVARQLATEALDQAIAQGGDPTIIADAQQALADGDALRASGAFKDAVAKYKDALAKAESAIS